MALSAVLVGGWMCSQDVVGIFLASFFCLFSLPLRRYGRYILHYNRNQQHVCMLWLVMDGIGDGQIDGEDGALAT